MRVAGKALMITLALAPVHLDLLLQVPEPTPLPALPEVVDVIVPRLCAAPLVI
jgi:hypothetical protein